MDEQEQEAPVTGMVAIGGKWHAGTLGDHVEDNRFKIWYETATGLRRAVVRDVKDESHWLEGATTAPERPAASASKPGGGTGGKKPAASTEVVQYATGPAKKGANTFPADRQFHVCTGACGKRLPARAFPTISGTDRRVSECRKCRDARRAAASSAAAA